MLNKWKREEAMLYYLYMTADGEVTESEKERFNTICAELHVKDIDRPAIIADCNLIKEDYKTALDAIVDQNFLDKLGNDQWGRKALGEVARIIWNLINLGYADIEYSDKEKEIVNYLLKRWNVDSVVYQEMIDTAETMLALVKQREHIIARKDNDANEKVAKIDAAIYDMCVDVNITISELM